MSEERPFKITVYDKNLIRKAIVSTPVELRVIPRHNLKGTATFKLALDHPALGDLMEAGSRVVIDYRGKQALSGPVVSRSINGPTISGGATFIVEDDFGILHSVLGWPVPASAISEQAAAENYVISGPAETVLKTVIKKNAIDRLGLNVTCAPDLGRGANVTLEVRMQPLFDRLLPLVEDAGLGITVRQGATGLVVDCYLPKNYAPILSEESGIVSDWSWTNTAPAVTDVVMGGRGEGVHREFRKFGDSAARGLWGRTLEAFVDGRDIGSALNEWYSRFDNATEALAKASEDYRMDDRQMSTYNFAAINADNARVGVDGSYPAGSAERAKALSDFQSALNQRDSSVTTAAASQARQTAAQATLDSINAEYAAIRAEYENLIALRASEALTAGAEKTGIRMVLSETDGFRYGDAVTVGDRVTMRVGPGLTLTDVLREAELTWTFEGGVTATPSVGEITDNPDRVFAKALRNSATRIRKIEVK